MSAARVWVPRPDQKRVLAWLDDRRRGLLIAPTGSGKTVMACTWLWQAMLDTFEVDKALVVAPKMVVDGWLEQMRTWQHLDGLAQECRVLPFDLLDLTPSVGSDGKRGALQFRDKAATKRRLLNVPGGRLHLCSWDAFPWVEEALGKSWPYGALVLDESSFVRDQGSSRAKAARRAVHKSGRVTHVLLMTATPNSNHDVAVFPQVDLVAPGLLGSTLTQFRDSYCVPDSKNWQTGQVYSWKVAPGQRQTFEQAVASVSIAVPDNLGIDVLPVEHWVDLPPAARQDYDDLARDQVLDVPRVTAASEAVLYAKLRQVASGFVYDDNETGHGMHDAKLAALQRLLGGLPEGKQAVIVYEFEEELARLRALLGKDFSDIRRKGAKDAFLAGQLRWLGIHPKSAGHGLDGLQAATNVIVWHTVPDDLEMWAQTNGRLKRPGQEAPTVMAHVLIARATVEERIWTEVLPQKQRRSDLLLTAVRAKDS